MCDSVSSSSSKVSDQVIRETPRQAGAPKHRQRFHKYLTPPASLCPAHKPAADGASSTYDILQTTTTTINLRLFISKIKDAMRKRTFKFSQVVSRPGSEVSR